MFRQRSSSESLVEKTTLSPLDDFGTLVKNNFTMYVHTSELSGLFHWSVCLSLCQYISSCIKEDENICSLIRTSLGERNLLQTKTGVGRESHATRVRRCKHLS
jgi:hypothetical protein